ncbi:hypothetical protein Zmor_014728 [Zophobas morio]|uniref:Uncharacterized protein n=1 Tax=Zophobas morio TaxID=2755281 RepID=A0AA38II02_9CUCU|nr:hypothetical protein Zmor_014728 [Zophobas morio]
MITRTGYGTISGRLMETYSIFKMNDSRCDRSLTQRLERMQVIVIVKKFCSSTTNISKILHDDLALRKLSVVGFPNGSESNRNCAEGSLVLEKEYLCYALHIA